MRYKIILITFFSILLCCTASYAEEADVRNVRWGMSIDDVQMNEFSFLESNKNGTLVYDIEKFSEKCKLIYIFENNKLVQCSYLFNINIHNDTKNIYSDIYKTICKKYKKIGTKSWMGEHEVFDGGKSYIVLAANRCILLSYLSPQFFLKEELKHNKKMKENEEKYNDDLKGL